MGEAGPPLLAVGVGFGVELVVESSIIEAPPGRHGEVATILAKKSEKIPKITIRKATIAAHL